MIKLPYVNIVGVFANDEEFVEIEDVATVFLIAERMIELTKKKKET